ncbi:MAG: DNA cytosine methyltransferase, partial [Clostridia bacterium]|nr:DNA cytosine methyltransferase [Clostridia bacterium]
PVEACRGRPVALAWFSPDCKHFSKAKGGKPKDKKIRGLAWIVLKWAALVRPRVIMLENVEEFQTWGPLNRGHRPIKAKTGYTFDKWKSQLKALGYKIEHRELRACDYGAPTTRKRFFLVARCDGLPIVWPDPTHGDPESMEVRCGILKPWRAAAEIIDWSIPCPSIFERKKPLAENTLRRIARGIQKFVVDNPEPFIVQVNHSGASWHYCNDINNPLPTVTSKHGFGVVAPFLAQYHSETSRDHVRGQDMTDPIMTLDTSNRYALVTSFITKFYKTGIGQSPKEPLHTVTTSPGHFGEVRTFLMTYYGNGDDLGQRVDEPLRTITTKDRFGIVTVAGQDYQIVDIGMRMLEPRELFKAQGFPDDYIIDRDYAGKAYPRSEQVARCGNAVPPPFAKVLTEANIPEHCQREQAS